MAKNRRKNKLRVQNRKPGVRSVFPGTLFSVLLGMTIFALGYLYLCGRCDALGKKINQLEKVRVTLRRDIVNEEYKWSKMTEPKNMEKLLQKHHLEMTWPSEDSVVRLRRNPPPQQFAKEGGLGEIVHD